MMRKLFLIGTSLFWLLVLTLWLQARQAPQVLTEGLVPVEKTYTLAELSQHSLESNCWMAINGQVYDVTSYLPDHPSRPSIILPWCGKEASEAYRTKTKGRAHSPAADVLLTDYRLGRLQDEPH